MKRLVLFFLLFGLLVSCSDNKKTGSKILIQTILVYMAGENSLSSFTQTNLKSIVEGAQNSSIDNCNLLVYIDSREKDTITHQAILPKLYKIEKNKSGIVAPVVVKTYEDQNSADIKIMNSVIEEVFEWYPANEKGLFLWSHGTAWLPSDLNNYTGLRSFGQDGSNHMEITELKEALPEGFDYIVFDACYMANVEVVYELRDKSNYFVGSSTEIMGDGFPYWLTLPELIADKPLEERLVDIATSFYNYYNAQEGAYRTGNISVVRSSGLVDLAAYCRSLLSGTYLEDQMVDPSEYGLNRQALEYLTRPFSYSFLYDFTDYLSLFTDKEIDLTSVVAYHATTPKAFFAEPYIQKPINTYSGLSIYVPQTKNPKMNEWYKQLDWYKAVYE